MAPNDFQVYNDYASPERTYSSRSRRRSLRGRSASTRRRSTTTTLTACRTTSSASARPPIARSPTTSGAVSGLPAGRAAARTHGPTSTSPASRRGRSGSPSRAARARGRRVRRRRRTTSIRAPSAASRASTRPSRTSSSTSSSSRTSAPIPSPAIPTWILEGTAAALETRVEPAAGRSRLDHPAAPWFSATERSMTSRATAPSSCGAGWTRSSRGFCPRCLPRLGGAARQPVKGSESLPRLMPASPAVRSRTRSTGSPSPS